MQQVSPKQYSPTDYTDPHPIRPQYKRLHVPQFYVTEIQNFKSGTSCYVICNETSKAVVYVRMQCHTSATVGFHTVTYKSIRNDKGGLMPPKKHLN